MASHPQFKSHWDSIPPPIPLESRPHIPSPPAVPRDTSTPTPTPTTEPLKHYENTANTDTTKASDLPNAKPPATTTQTHQQFLSHWASKPAAPTTPERPPTGEDTVDNLATLLQSASIAEQPAPEAADLLPAKTTTGATQFKSHWDNIAVSATESTRVPQSTKPKAQALHFQPSIVTTPEPKSSTGFMSHWDTLDAIPIARIHEPPATAEPKESTDADLVAGLERLGLGKRVKAKKVDAKEEGGKGKTFVSHWDLVDSGALGPCEANPLAKPKEE